MLPQNMRNPQCPRSPGFCSSSANLICGIGQVTSPLWASISSTARYDCDGGGKVVTLKWAFFVFLPPSDSLGHVCAGRSGGCWSGERQCFKGECVGGKAELQPVSPASTSMAALKLLTLHLIFFFFQWHHVTKSAPCYNHCSSSELN